MANIRLDHFSLDHLIFKLIHSLTFSHCFFFFPQLCLKKGKEVLLSKMNLKKHLTRRHNVAKPVADTMIRDMCKSRPGFTEVRRVVQQALHCRTRLFLSWATWK